MKRRINIGLLAITVVYVVFLVRIIIFKYGDIGFYESYNLIPLKFSVELFLGYGNVSTILYQALGNIALFVPLGMLLPLAFNNTGAGKVILTGFLLSLTLEMVQFFTYIGVGDIDDLILNTLGSALGYALTYLIIGIKNGGKVAGCNIVRE